jgi:hypothetical protein
LKGAGFTLRTGLNPSAVKLIYEPAVRLLTGNGPQTIDAQAQTIRSIPSTRSELNRPTAAVRQGGVVKAGN